MTQPTILLHNGIQMPRLGLGTWQAKDGGEVERAVTAAMSVGYRLIDTAAAYGNESGIGKAIHRSSIPRNELFITTKVWNADQGYDQTIKAFDKSMKRLGLHYIDLYLIHWPMPAADKYIDTWRSMEELYKTGKVRAIGVCNFSIEQLQRLIAETSIVPMVNQIELHPYFLQTDLRNYCTQNQIAIEAYSPLGGSTGKLLDDPVIIDIATAHSVTPAQVVIRWHIQQGHVVIPKSTHTERITSNMQVFDFELNPDEMTRIDALDKNQRVGTDPETANFNWNTNLVQIAHYLGLVHW